MTVEEFIAKYKITSNCEWVARNPLMDMPRNFKVTLKRGRKRMTVIFSQGEAWKTDPTAADVLDCLASDSNGYDNTSNFNDWCADYGYEPENNDHVKKIYAAVKKQARRLKEFLGGAYDELIECDRM